MSQIATVIDIISKISYALILLNDKFQRHKLFVIVIMCPYDYNDMVNIIERELSLSIHAALENFR